MSSHQSLLGRRAGEAQDGGAEDAGDKSRPALGSSWLKTSQQQENPVTRTPFCLPHTSPGTILHLSIPLASLDHFPRPLPPNVSTT